MCLFSLLNMFTRFYRAKGAQNYMVLRYRFSPFVFLLWQYLSVFTGYFRYRLYQNWTSVAKVYSQQR